MSAAPAAERVAGWRADAATASPASGTMSPQPPSSQALRLRAPAANMSSLLHHSRHASSAALFTRAPAARHADAGGSRR